MPGRSPFRLQEGGRKAALAESCIPPAAGSRCGAKNQRGMTLLTSLLLSPPPPSAHQVRGSTGSRDRGCHRGGVTAAGAVLSGSLLLAAQAGGPTEEAQVRGACPPPSNPTVAHLGRDYSGEGAHRQQPLSLQCHGEGEIAQGREGLQAWPAGEWDLGPGQAAVLPGSSEGWGGKRQAPADRGLMCDPPLQTPVLYAMLDHSRSTKAASEKKSKGLGESRKDKK